MSAITIRLAWPPEELDPNKRPNRWAKADATRSYRYASKIDARKAMDCKTEYPLKAPVEALVTFYVTRGRGPDNDNASAMLKAGWDGICDAGILANDRDIVSLQVFVEKGLRREVVVILSEKQL